jgi:flagellar protein FlbD
MIQVTETNGNKKFVNSDLIEKIDQMPETLLTFLNGHNIIVQESPEEVVDKIVQFKQRCSLSITSPSELIENSKNF